MIRKWSVCYLLVWDNIQTLEHENYFLNSSLFPPRVQLWSATSSWSWRPCSWWVSEADPGDVARIHDRWLPWPQHSCPRPIRGSKVWDSSHRVGNIFVKNISYDNISREDIIKADISIDNLVITNLSTFITEIAHLDVEDLALELELRIPQLRVINTIHDSKVSDSKSRVTPSTTWLEIFLVFSRSTEMVPCTWRLISWMCTPRLLSSSTSRDTSSSSQCNSGKVSKKKRIMELSIERVIFFLETRPQIEQLLNKRSLHFSWKCSNNILFFLIYFYFNLIFFFKPSLSANFTDIRAHLDNLLGGGNFGESVNNLLNLLGDFIWDAVWREGLKKIEFYIHRGKKFEIFHDPFLNANGGGRV